MSTHKLRIYQADHAWADAAFDLQKSNENLAKYVKNLPKGGLFYWVAHDDADDVEVQQFQEWLTRMAPTARLFTFPSRWFPGLVNMLHLPNEQDDVGLNLAWGPYSKKDSDA